MTTSALAGYRESSLLEQHLVVTKDCLARGERLLAKGQLVIGGDLLRYTVFGTTIQIRSTDPDHGEIKKGGRPGSHKRTGCREYSNPFSALPLAEQSDHHVENQQPQCRIGKKPVPDQYPPTRLSDTEQHDISATDTEQQQDGGQEVTARNRQRPADTYRTTLMINGIEQRTDEKEQAEDRMHQIMQRTTRDAQIHQIRNQPGERRNAE